MSDLAVIIAGGGRGERFGADENKLFAKLDGRPVFIRTLELFINRSDVAQTLLVVPSGQLETVKTQYGPNLGFMGVELVEGGAERHDSIARGLARIRDDLSWVAIHDAVRPCLTSDMIDRVLAEARKTDAAILAAPIHGTIKRVSESGTIDATVSRKGLFEAQTPQVFRLELIRKAHEEKPDDASEMTDDAQLVERLDHPVSIVESDRTNIKITTKGDIALANAIIKSRPSKPAPRRGAFDEAQW